jgi:hypothetical protein
MVFVGQLTTYLRVVGHGDCSRKLSLIEGEWRRENRAVRRRDKEKKIDEETGWDGEEIG